MHECNFFSEDSIQETTFPLPPPTEDLFSQATKPIVRLLESKFISNSVSNASKSHINSVG